jgi:CheY-like chemotaxis protein
MNGFQATAYIREKLQLQIPIVILTASVLRNERDKCLSLGANDYMSKPFNHAHLDLCLQKYLHGDSRDLTELSEKAHTANSPEVLDKGYDLSNLFELGDAESIRSVLGIFLKRFPQHIDELRAIVLMEDKEGFLEKSHKFRGSLTTIQIPVIYELATSAEILVNGYDSWENVLKILDKITTIYTTLTTEISTEVEQQILQGNI